MIFYKKCFLLCAVFTFSIFFLNAFNVSAVSFNIDTSVVISVCGDGVVSATEVCDLGPGLNTGAYSTSIGGRVCAPDCNGYGPYCGDDILQVRFSEECDDGNNTSGDLCTDICIEEAGALNPLPPGGGGRSPSGGIVQSPSIPSTVSSLVETKVVVHGTAYPLAKINILVDGIQHSIVNSDINGDFLYSTIEMKPGVATLGFIAEDVHGINSILFTSTFDVIQSAVTTVKGIRLPPTILLDTNFDENRLMNISGQSVPKSNIFTVINTEPLLELESLTELNGDWKTQLDLASLPANDSYLVKARYKIKNIDGAEIESGYSRAHVFSSLDGSVSDSPVADLNGDGKINLVDFSIFLTFWGTSNPLADFNNDNKVNIADFSIMLFYWTG